MSTVDDSSATSSFEDVHDELKEAKSDEPNQDDAFLTGPLAGGLGKVVADQVCYFYKNSFTYCTYNLSFYQGCPVDQGSRNVFFFGIHLLTI